MNHYQFFHQLHHKSEPFFLPNAWDPLSAIVLQQTGFKAIGTTSWGMANSIGKRDGELSDISVFFNQINSLIQAVTIPVTVDIESGYSDDIDTICTNVLAVAKLGAVGVNIEDSSKKTGKLRSIEQQSTILEAIKRTLITSGFPNFFINARIDTFVTSNNSYQEAYQRAISYESVGVDGIFIPALTDKKHIKNILNKINIPFNIMILNELNNLSLLNDLGVKRVSIGNALSDKVINYLSQQAKLLFNSNDFSDFLLQDDIDIKFT